MNKKIGLIAIVCTLLTVFAVALAFADGQKGNISWTANTASVHNSKSKTVKKIEGSICVYLIHKDGERKMTDDQSYSVKNVSGYGSKIIYTTPNPNWTIYNVDDKTCFFEE